MGTLKGETPSLRHAVVGASFVESHERIVDRVPNSADSRCSAPHCKRHKGSRLVGVDTDTRGNGSSDHNRRTDVETLL
jgi:hypothetical protein